jgi:hypothetical protein
MSFIKDFRIIFLREKIRFRKELSKKIGARQQCDWACAKGKLVTTLVGAAREDKTGKDKQAARGKFGPKSKGNIEKSFSFS